MYTQNMYKHVLNYFYLPVKVYETDFLSLPTYVRIYISPQKDKPQVWDSANTSLAVFSSHHSVLC